MPTTSLAHAGVTADPPVAPPTGQVTVTGQHFPPNHRVEVFLKWKRCSLDTDATGLFSCTFKVPKSLAPGQHTIWTVDRDKGNWTKAGFTVRADWGNAAFDTGRTRHNPYENILAPSNVGQMKRLWSHRGQLQLVAGGKVLIQSPEFEGLLALDEANGTEAWRITLAPGEHVQGIAYAMEHVYLLTFNNHETAPWAQEICSDTENPCHASLRSVTAIEGTLMWERQVASVYGNYNNYHGQLAAAPHTGSVFIWQTSYDQGSPWYTRHRLSRWSLLDGTELWTKEKGTLGYRWPWKDVLVAGDFAYMNLYLDDSYGDLYQNAVGRIDDGTPVWIGQDHWCYDPGSCRQVVPRFTNARSDLLVETSTPLRYEAVVPRVTISDPNHGTPIPLWSWTDSGGRHIGTPALAGNLLVVGTAEGTVGSYLQAFKATNGKQLWHRTISGSATIQPTVANDVIYLGNKAYDARNGKLLWRSRELVDTISPIVVNGRLYANQTDGSVSAWGLQ